MMCSLLKIPVKVDGELNLILIMMIMMLLMMLSTMLSMMLSMMMMMMMMVKIVHSTTLLTRSMGSGNMIVEFFSALMLFNV